ncbi:MAG: T9SS type A sorting domain-containing protein [Candidatus Eisenbacteria bacterium]|nr:T9SS type A sorting domain-containing protein [Candidatus Eisenbacteria bacterium]MBU1949292.1 T9SS type A sorting domain-containing protein [Candidatus Eisenbacteria bacterium]
MTCRSWPLFLLILLIPDQCALSSEILRVDPINGPFYTIQSAIDSCEAYDIVELAPASFDESVTIETKSITIRSTDGPAATIWDGSGQHRLILAADCNLTLEGITFQNGWTDVGGGGAVRARHSILQIQDCAFRGNVVGCAPTGRTQGGAIYLSGSNSGVDIRRSLFVENRTIGDMNNGGAVAFTIFDSGLNPNSDAADPALQANPGSMTIEDCTFLRNVSGWDGSAVMDWVSSVLSVQRCLFIENRRLGGLRTGGIFTLSSGLLNLHCCLIWEESSPVIDDRELLAQENLAGYFYADPRICPDDPETIHESSPALTWLGCPDIGNLPVGCRGPIVLSVRAHPLNPEAAQIIRIYGYGLDEVDGATLESSEGEIYEDVRLSHDDTWLAVTFDLLGADPGSWTLRLFEGGEPVASLEEAVTVLPFTVLAFLEPWIETRDSRSLKLAQRGWTGEIGLELVHSEIDERIPFQEMEQIASDTLLLNADFQWAADGVYDLEVTKGTQAVRVEDVLYVGIPPVLRVPDDYETIPDAILAAPPGAEIQVGEGIYPESVVVDRPIRLRGQGRTTRISLAESETTRCVHILESAGRITRIDSLTIERGAPASGSGGGLLAEAPVTVHACNFYYNRAGLGNGGAACLAPGSQVLGSNFMYNGLNGGESGVVSDPFAGAHGVAGALFCLDCRVENSQFEGNFAPCVGAAAVRGLFRNNHLGYNFDSWYEGDGIDALAAQGEITGNRFENSCGSDGPPIAFILGPSSVSYNTFSDYWQDMCYELSLVQLQGPVDFFHNTLAGTGLQICTHIQTPPGPGDKIRIYNNLIESGRAHYPDLFYCRRRLVLGPVFSIPTTNIESSCNLGDDIAIYSPSGRYECPDCVHEMHDVGYCEVPYDDGYHSYGEFNLRLRLNSPALPNNSPIGCADTLGAQPVGCDVVPVLVSGAQVGLTDDGVELSWTLSSDLSVLGFGLMRENDGQRIELTAEPMPPCNQCRYLDHEALLLSGPTEYWLTILWDNGREDIVPLGGLALTAPREMRLDPPHPNPVSVAGSVSFYLPRKSYAQVELIDVAGRRVMKLLEAWTDPGRTIISLHQEIPQLQSGIYWIRLSAEGQSRTRRFVVVR